MGSPEQTETTCAGYGCECCSRLSSQSLPVRWCWQQGLKAPSVSRPTSVRGYRQLSWVASSQGMFKPMRGVGSRFSNVRSNQPLAGLVNL